MRIQIMFPKVLLKRSLADPLQVNHTRLFSYWQVTLRVPDKFRHLELPSNKGLLSARVQTSEEARDEAESTASAAVVSHFKTERRRSVLDVAKLAVASMSKGLEETINSKSRRVSLLKRAETYVHFDEDLFEVPFDGPV